MTEWKQIAVEKKQIKFEKENSVLLRLPDDSEYAGFAVFYPKKLIKESKNKNVKTLSIKDSMEFRIHKWDMEKKQISEEKTITGTEFLRSFKASY